MTHKAASPSDGAGVGAAREARLTEPAELQLGLTAADPTVAGAEVVDLFAGPGGWDTGASWLGLDDVLGIEWDAAACETAIAAGHHRLQADVAALRPSDIVGATLRGLIASPPCQGFSLAGEGRGRRDSERIIAAVAEFASGHDPRDDLAAEVEDSRSVLALEPLRWALELEPEWMAWEQVPAVLPLWQACAEALRADGYEVWTGNVHAEQYGVPQVRKRAILAARRTSGLLVPTPTHSRYYARTPTKLDTGVEKWVSMAEGIGFGMTHRPACTVSCGRNGGGSDPLSGGSGSRAAYVREQNAGRWLHRTHGDVPQWKAKGYVRVSVEEAAILQGFPTNYPWRGSRTAQYRQVGDAMPPPMAAHVLGAVTGVPMAGSVAA